MLAQRLVFIPAAHVLGLQHHHAGIAGTLRGDRLQHLRLVLLCCALPVGRALFELLHAHVHVDQAGLEALQVRVLTLELFAHLPPLVLQRAQLRLHGVALDRPHRLLFAEGRERRFLAVQLALQLALDLRLREHLLLQLPHGLVVPRDTLLLPGLALERLGVQRRVLVLGVGELVLEQRDLALQGRCPLAGVHGHGHGPCPLGRPLLVRRRRARRPRARELSASAGRLKCSGSSVESAKLQQRPPATFVRARHQHRHERRT